MKPELLEKLKAELELDDFVSVCRAFAVSDLLDVDFVSNLRSTSSMLSSVADHVDIIISNLDESDCCGGCMADCNCDGSCGFVCGSDDCRCFKRSDKDCCTCCGNDPCIDMDDDFVNVPKVSNFLFDEVGETFIQSESSPSTNVTTHRISCSGLD